VDKAFCPNEAKSLQLKYSGHGLLLGIDLEQFHKSHLLRSID